MSYAFLLCALAARSMVGVASEVEEAREGAPAAFSWGDFDGDGRLDLAAVHLDGRLQLLVDGGDGRFEDVTAAAGIGGHPGKALGVVPIDHDGDGWPDLAVANDTTADFLFLNQRDGTFREVGLRRRFELIIDEMTTCLAGRFRVELDTGIVGGWFSVPLP